MSFIQYSMVQRSGCYGSSRNTNPQDSSDSKKSDRQDSLFNPQLHKTCAHFNPKAYRNLGKSGLRVSNIALGTLATFGCQISDEVVAEELLTLAYENGVNVFDTSEVYAAGKAEIVLGKILKRKNWRRSSYIVCTKIFWGGKAETEKGLSRKHIIEGLRASLERLQMDYVDVILAGKFDPKTPVEEMARAFTHVINMGWAMYWGTSRWSPTEIMEIYSVCRQFNLIPPIVEQSEYNFFRREAIELSMPELFQKIGLGLMAASPLAGGILSGKYRNEMPPNCRANLKGFDWLKEKILSKDGKKQQSLIKKLSHVSDKLECTPSQLAIAWCLKNENVHCVVLGATTVEQLVEDLLSVHVISKLTANILTEINDILGNSYLTSEESLQA